MMGLSQKVYPTDPRTPRPTRRPVTCRRRRRPPGGNQSFSPPRRSAWRTTGSFGAEHCHCRRVCGGGARQRAERHEHPRRHSPADDSRRRKPDQDPPPAQENHRTIRYVFRSITYSPLVHLGFAIGALALLFQDEELLIRPREARRKEHALLHHRAQSGRSDCDTVAARSSSTSRLAT